MKANTAIVLNIFVKEEANIYIAHCLELDIVTTSADRKDVVTDIIDLIKTQINYAFSNNNLNHLYRPAPSEVWEEFYSCRERIQEQKVDIGQDYKNAHNSFVPPWIIARTCSSTRQNCRV